MRQIPRALSPAQEAAVRKVFAMMEPGLIRHSRTSGRVAAVRQLANAYSVSERTMYRTIFERCEEETHVVELAGYRATFVIDELGPKQRTDWVAIP